MSLIPSVFQKCPDCCVLINNASVFQQSQFFETTSDQFDLFFQIHVKTPFFLAQTFAEHCKEGHIINMIDAKVTKNLIQHFTYGLSKKCLFNFTEMAAKTLGPDIRVNGVAPGIILPSGESTEEDLNRMAEKIPLERKGRIKDVVSSVLFLVDHPYLTGQIIFADGGEHLP